MPRFHLDPALWGEGAALTGDEARHCARVLRASVGDSVTVFDGEGRSAVAEVLTVSKDRVDLRLGEVLVEPRPKVEIILAQAVIKGKAMDWLLQKAAELGVSAIQPLETRHAVVQAAGGKEEKWQRVVSEACKQCGRSRIPKVLPVMDLASFLATSANGPRIIASLGEGAIPLRDRMADMASPVSVTFLVGPEGDFAPSEYDAAVKAGCLPVSLGLLVLRSETAGIFCLAAATYAML